MTSLRHITSSEGSPQDAYLDAARACLLDVGWRRTTLTEVARRAGVSRMTIYRTWADMPTLLGDLMTREWTGVVEDTAGAGGLVERMVATIRALRVNELFVRIVEVDPELVLPYLLARRGRSQELVLGIAEAAIVAGQEAGEVRPGNPTAIARALVLAAHGFVLSAHTMVDERVGEAELDAELSLVLTRVLAP
jgi:AcrR family transcriptional regulator